MIEEKPEGSRERLKLAFVLMMTAGLSFSAMATLTKTLSQTFGLFDLVFFRYLIGFICVLTVVLAHRNSSTSWKNLFVPAGIWLLVARGTLGFVGVLSFFYILRVLPVSLCVLLNFCFPIFVVILARIFLNERITAEQVSWILVGIFGVGLATRAYSTPEESTLQVFGIFIGLLSALASGSAYVFLRAASTQHSVSTILLYFTGCGLLGSFLFIKPLQWPEVSLSSGIWLWVLLCGCLGLISQICITFAYRQARAPLVSAMGLSGVIFSVGWESAVFQQSVRLGEALSLALILASILCVLLRPIEHFRIKCKNSEFFR